MGSLCTLPWLEGQGPDLAYVGAARRAISASSGQLGDSCTHRANNHCIRRSDRGRQLTHPFGEALRIGAEALAGTGRSDHRRCSVSTIVGNRSFSR